MNCFRLDSAILERYAAFHSSPLTIVIGLLKRLGSACLKKSGAIAQLGERLHGMQEVSGSIPLSSTKALFLLRK
jgi:hypothetical protein